VGSQPLVRNCKIKSNKSTKAKKIGHSQTQGIASEIQLKLDDDFEIQGIVKQLLSTCA
jgi:hypothetical protein